MGVTREEGVVIIGCFSVFLLRWTHDLLLRQEETRGGWLMVGKAEGYWKIDGMKKCCNDDFRSLLILDSNLEDFSKSIKISEANI